MTDGSIGEARRLAARLTAGQRAALRLVFRHFNSKEIAERLGVSPSAIDKRIERAVAIMQATSRVDAARRLALAEGTYDRTPSEPSDLATPPPSVMPPSCDPSPLPDQPAPGRAAPPPRVRTPVLGRLAAIVAMILGLSVSLLVTMTVAERIAALWPHRSGDPR